MPRTRTLLGLAASIATAAALLSAAPAANAVEAGASPGCGAEPPDPPGTSAEHIIDSGGRKRSYQLHLPDDYTSAHAWPVILVYHGRGNSGPTTEQFSKLSKLPAIVAYPNAEVGEENKRAWEGAPYSPPGVDDVAFTEDLLDDLEAGLCVAPQRVYATGKSNGAAFTGILACRLADRIAAIAPVSGAFYPEGETDDGCTPSRPVPVLEFHGTADTTIPYEGDAERGLPPIRTWVGDWAARDGCGTEPMQRDIEPDIEIYTYGDCTADTSVKHVAVVGGGHTWPGADEYSGGGYTTQTIEAHRVIWQFFRQYQVAARS